MTAINVESAAIRYQQQKAGAARRGVSWEMTFDQWLSIWDASGRWEKRGIGRDKYVMARRGDVGPYAVGNVDIITQAQNTADAHANGCFTYKPPQRAGDIFFDTAPEFAPADVVAACHTFREAVRACWGARRVQRLTNRSLAVLIEVYPSHVSDWFASDDDHRRRNLPAHLIADFEWVCGNRIVSQWLALRAGLTLSI
jgi:hypothetical protein